MKKLMRTQTKVDIALTTFTSFFFGPIAYLFISFNTFLFTLIATCVFNIILFYVFPFNSLFHLTQLFAFAYCGYRFGKIRNKYIEANLYTNNLDEDVLKLKKFKKDKKISLFLTVELLQTLIDFYLIVLLLYSSYNEYNNDNVMSSIITTVIGIPFGIYVIDKIFDFFKIPLS